MKFKVILPVFTFVFSFILMFNFPSIYKILAASLFNSGMFFVLGFLLDRRKDQPGFALPKKVFYILFLSSFIYFSLFYAFFSIFVFSENAGMIGGTNGPYWIYIFVLVIVYLISIFIVMKNHSGFVFAVLFIFSSLAISYYSTYFLSFGLSCKNNKDLPFVVGSNFNKEEYEKFKYKNILTNTVYNIGEMYSNGHGICQSFPWYIKTLSKGDESLLFINMKTF